jgi:hypothetical protein
MQTTDKSAIRSYLELNYKVTFSIEDMWLWICNSPPSIK